MAEIESLDNFNQALLGDLQLLQDDSRKIQKSAKSFVSGKFITTKEEFMLQENIKMQQEINLERNLHGLSSEHLPLEGETWKTKEYSMEQKMSPLYRLKSSPVVQVGILISPEATITMNSDINHHHPDDDNAL